MAEFLSRGTAFKALAEHIICPSREGDISTSICLVMRIDPESAARSINCALQTSPPKLFGEVITENAWQSGGYINFSVTNEFVYAAASEWTKNLPIPSTIPGITTDAAYALARAAEVYEGYRRNTVTEDDDRHVRVLWKLLALLDDRADSAYAKAALHAVIDILTEFPLRVPRGLDIREYTEWLIKILYAYMCRS